MWCVSVRVYIPGMPDWHEYGNCLYSRHARLTFIRKLLRCVEHINLISNMLSLSCFNMFRFLGFKKTLLLDRKLLVNLIDKYNTRKLNWEKFSLLVKEAHASHWGTPIKRIVIPGKPKLEDYFWSNPQECLPPTEELSSSDCWLLLWSQSSYVVCIN